ncbi:hypothetical protein [Catenuloplanes japonicus]|uniref:hypothetical protein n=1 Tax=Catenuloplanes japonicus TaxID=33876 RepID=UPI000524ED2E|nr:hypothetical protein [Catenuloplanes japonicus]
MRIGTPDPGHRDTPAPAPGIRLFLSAFGLISSLIFAPILFATGSHAFGWIFVALAVIALGDLANVIFRR